MVVIIPIQRNIKKRTTTHEMWRKRARKKWRMTTADLEEWNNERSKRKVGRLLQASVEFFGAQLRILWATTTVRGVQRRRRPIAVSDGTAAARHKQMQPPPPHPTPHRHPVRQPRTSCPLALLTLTSRASADRPSGRTELLRTAKWASRQRRLGPPARPPGCRQLFQPRKGNTCGVVSSTFCRRTYSHRLTNGWTDRQTDGRTDGRVKKTDGLHAAAGTKCKRQRLKTPADQFRRKYFIRRFYVSFSPFST